MGGKEEGQWAGVWRRSAPFQGGWALQFLMTELLECTGRKTGETGQGRGVMSLRPVMQLILSRRGESRKGRGMGVTSHPVLHL